MSVCVVEVDDGVMKNEDAWHFRFSVSTDEPSARGWKGIRVFSRVLFPAPFICWCLTSFINRPTTLKTKGDIAILKSSKRSNCATLHCVNQLQEPRCDISHTRIQTSLIADAFIEKGTCTDQIYCYNHIYIIYRLLKLQELFSARFHQMSLLMWIRISCVFI